jgi:DNA-binding transcriptional LysR family regulator
MCITTDDFSFLNHAGEEHLLHNQVLFSDEFVCIVAEDHPLNPPISLNDYLLYPHVGVQIEGIADTIVGASFRRHVSSYKPTYTVPEFMLVPHIVAGSAAIGVVQRRLALLSSKSLPLKMSAPPFHIPNINETLLWHPRHSCDPAYLWLRQIVAREAEQELRPGEIRASRKPYQDKGALAAAV